MRHHLLLATASVIAMSAIGPIHAQAQENETEARRLDRVTVTAVKREQDIQDVPVSVTAFTDEMRQELGLDTITDFARLTPSLAYSSGDDRVFVRGVGRQTNTNGSEPGVATYSDGIYNSSTSSVSRSDFFIERVEILRGPQGTLYGRNSIGGAINVISKRPTDEFSAEGRAYVGNYETTRFEANVSGPIVKGLNAKLAGSHNNQEDGYFENVAGGKSEGGAGDGTYIELQLDAQPTENLSLWLKLDTDSRSGRPRTKNRVDPYDLTPFPTGYITPGSGFGYLQPGFTQKGSALTNPGISDVRKISTDSTSSSELDDAYGISGIATWSLPSIDLKYMGGYRTSNYSAASDLDGTSITSYAFPLDPANPAAGELFTGGPNCQFYLDFVGPICAPTTVYPSQRFLFGEDKSFSSHELTAQSSSDSALWWIVGAYYYNEDLFQESHFNNFAEPALQAPLGSAPNPSGDFVLAASDLNTKSYAIFGQTDYAITDTITLTGGLRYSKDEKSGDEWIRVVGYGDAAGLTLGGSGNLLPALDYTTASISFGPAEGVVSAVTIDPITGAAYRQLENDWSAVSGTAGVQWQPDEFTNYYFRYSRGYKSGGFNAGGISQIPQTDEELLDAFEIGSKKTFGNQLQLNASVYYYAYDGLQTPLTVEENGINITRFFNIQDSTAHGVELEGLWTPTDDLRFIANYAYNDSEVNEACCFNDSADPLGVQPGSQPSGPLDANGNQPQDLKGNQLPRTIPHKLSLSASYDVDLGGNGDLTLSGTYAWQDSTYHSIFNRDYTQSPSYDQVDLIAVWRSPNDAYRIIGTVKNLFDEEGYDSASGDLALVSSTVAQTYGFTPPRVFGVELQARF